MLALICAAGRVRQQSAKTHYASIMLEISMTSLFTPTVPTLFACFFFFLKLFLLLHRKSCTETKHVMKSDVTYTLTIMNTCHVIINLIPRGLDFSLFKMLLIANKMLTVEAGIVYQLIISNNLK